MKKITLIALILFSVIVLASCKKDEPTIDPVYELNTDLTDGLSLETSYEDREFISNGVGEVELVKCTDGDTATFRSGSNSFAVRFLGIDTPESTYRFDAWGKAASDYTCDKLTNANEIVLESDGDRMDGNERYLAWVWYDGRLLNLELVEQAYSSSKASITGKYESYLYQAELYAQQTKKRVWGEIDPDFDYSVDGVQITIEELVKNADDYYQRKVVVEGLITAMISGDVYIQNGEYGVFLYTGYEEMYLKVGDYVRIEALTATYFPDKETGQLQLSNYRARNVKTISRDNEVTPVLKTISEIDKVNLGSLLQINDLTVKSVNFSEDSNRFTVNFEDASGNTIALRNESQNIDIDAAKALFTVDNVLNIKGPLALYYQNYQLMLGSLESVEIAD